MKFFGYAGRFVVMGLVLTWFVLAYAVGRIGAALAGSAEGRRRAVASLRGRVLRGAMTTLGATFVKLGQVMSTRPDLLERETIDELRALQDRLPAFPIVHVRRIVEEDLGAPVDERFAELDDVPIAAASVSQVHRARLPGGREVAVKVLRPDVRARVERDAAILGLFARVLAWHPTLRLSDPVGHLEQLFAGILDQTDLRLEAAHYERFRASFAGTKGVHFPEVVAELSATRVMTMELLRGTKLDALPPGDHADVAKRLQQIFLKMCFEDGFVHADLHPGNMLLLDNGDIAIFDVGLVKHLTGEILEQYIDFVRCLAMGTTKDFLEHIRRFHSYRGEIDWVTLETELDHFLTRFRGQNVAELELGELMNEILALGRRYRVRPVADMALIMVAMVTAEGIGKQLNPEANLFEDTAAFLGPLLAKRAAGHAA
ncbi:MAG TPA: AarF/UbiB family protein [Polyangiaceae bacterium]|jgi:ubiquinone biosynthesis protein